MWLILPRRYPGKAKWFSAIVHSGFGRSRGMFSLCEVQIVIMDHLDSATVTKPRRDGSIRTVCAIEPASRCLDIVDFVSDWTRLRSCEATVGSF